MPSDNDKVPNFFFFFKSRHARLYVVPRLDIYQVSALDGLSKFIGRLHIHLSYETALPRDVLCKLLRHNITSRRIQHITINEPHRVPCHIRI